MHILPVIQARMGSTRLPGKMLESIQGRSLLSWVIRAAFLSEVHERVVVATSSLADDDPLAAAAEAEGAECFRGDPNDVLSRYVNIASRERVDACVRITGDSPFQDPALIAATAARFVEEVDASYVATFPPRTLPLGLDVEVVSTRALVQLDRIAHAHHRVHVTSLMYERAELFRGVSIQFSSDASNLRATVDTQEDLDAARQIASALPNPPYPWEAIVELLTERADIRTLNAHIKQRDVTEG